MDNPLRDQIEALHGLGPAWLGTFLADVIDVTGCREDVLTLLRAYSDISKGYVRARKK